MIKIIGEFSRRLIDENGNLEISFTIKNWAFKRFTKELKHIDYEIEIKEPKSQRSINQNNLFWGLVGEIVKATGIDKDDLYAQLLEMAKAEYDTFTIIDSHDNTVKRLRQMFRAVKVVEQYTDKGVDYISFWGFKGSSKFNTKQMSELIEIVKDYAEQSGVDTEL